MQQRILPSVVIGAILVLCTMHNVGGAIVRDLADDPTGELFAFGYLLRGGFYADWEPDPQCPYPSDNETYFAYPGNCSKYYKCIGGNKTVEDCPEGFLWHDEIKKCDFPGDFCSNDTTSSTDTTPTDTPTMTTAPTIPPTESPSTTIPTTPPTEAPSTTTTPTDVPTSTTTSPTTETPTPTTLSTETPTATTESTITPTETPTSTTPPTTTPTAPPTSTTPPTTTPTEPPISTTTTEGPTTEYVDPRCADGTNSYWAIPEYCHKYIECYDGKTYVMSCPADLFFSESMKKCVAASESECCAEYECARVNYIY